MLALEAPRWLNDPLADFSLSYDQQRLAARYMTGLVVSKSKTISAASSVFPRQSSIALNRLLTQYDWDENKINAERLGYLQRHNETRRGCKGVLIIDDVVVEKTGRHIPYVGRFFDHSKGTYVMGQNVVDMHYADIKTDYPIDYRFIGTLPNGKVIVQK